MAGDFLTGILVDSDVLIWTLRGNPKALAHMQELADWHISAVSYMELAQGCRNKTELKAMQKAFKSASSDVLPITMAISDLACQLVEAHALTRSLYMADALIAATAISYSLPLLTANTKHFAAVPGLEVQVFKP
jgi:predicted nucleic acid-binding protein